jgi:Zn finger protein HypA/HybF involved in hydrogenase expression
MSYKSSVGNKQEKPQMRKCVNCNKTFSPSKSFTWCHTCFDKQAVIEAERNARVACEQQNIMVAAARKMGLTDEQIAEIFKGAA